MKKALIGIVALALITLSVTSCKKTTAVNGGSWTFKDSTNTAVNYTVSSGIADVSQNPAAYGLYGIATLATASQTNGYSSIVFTFFSYPTASGSYTITPNQFPDSGSHEIAINMILSSGGPSYAQKNFNPSVTSAAGATANVTVMNNGYIKIAIPSLEMINYYNPNDSGLLSTSVLQTQPAE